MGSSTTTTKGARRSTKESSTTAIGNGVGVSSGQSAAIYLRRSAMGERGDSASIMAITEALKPKRLNSVVHDFGIHEVVLTGHQRHLRAFYGNQIPEYAIDKN